MTFAVTALVSRIYPISTKSEAYKDGLEPQREKTGSGNVLLTAWKAGVSRAGEAPEIMSAIGSILHRVFPILCEITGTSMFVITAGLLAASHTNLFYYLGLPFLPVLKLVGIVAEEMNCLVQAIGSCLLEPVLAGVICTGQEMSMQARWIAVIVPYSSIFLPALFPARDLRKSAVRYGKCW